MTARNQTLHTLRAGGSECCVWLALGSAAIAELAAAAGARSIVFDLQHGLWERTALEAAVGLVRATATPIVRVAENSAFSIGAALDSGAHGVLVPMVGTPAEAAAAVAAAHFPPNGIRSGGGVRPLADFPGYRQFAATEIVVGIMIETVAAAEDAASILAVPGIDLVFIGSGDLGISLEASGRKDLTLERLVDGISKAAAARSVPCGIFTNTAIEARQRAAQGFRFTVAQSDVTLIRAGVADALRGAAPASP